MSCYDMAKIRIIKPIFSIGWQQEFEKLFCKYTSSKFSTTVSNCTSGLHLACIAVGLKKIPIGKKYF